MIGPGGLLLIVPQVIYSSSFSFIGRVCQSKKVVKNSDISFHYPELHSEHQVEMLWYTWIWEREDRDWVNERKKETTHTHTNNNKMKPTLSWTFLPRKAIQLSHYSKTDGHFTVIAWMMDLLWTQEGPKSPPIVKFCFWNLAGGAQQTDIIHSFTLWNGSLVYPYSIILNDVCPHGHLHFLTSLQLASFLFFVTQKFWAWSFHHSPPFY
jgi:hypothetical protein